MNINCCGSTDQTSYPLALMQPPPDMADALAQTTPRIHSPDETPRALIGNAAAWLPHGEPDGRAPRAGGGVQPLERIGGKAAPDRLDDSGERVQDSKDGKCNPVRDTWDPDGRHTRDSVDANGTRIHDTWDTDGKHTRDTLDANGARIHDTWDADGKHTRDTVDANGDRIHDTWDADGEYIHESSNESGKHVRDRWDLSGNHIRDAWDANGNHIRDVWDANGKHKHIVWHEKANNIPPSMDPDDLTPGAAAHNGRPMPRPVVGDPPASSPLPGNGAGNGEPSEPVGGGDGGQPAEPTGDGGGLPSAPTGGDGGQPSAPIGDGGGDIQAPDNNTGYTDYDQPSPGSARTPALIGLTSEQRGIVTRAYQHVKRMIDSALDKLKSGHPDENFSRWFGSPTQRNVQKVEQVLTHMQHAISHDQFTFVLGAPQDNWELAHVQFNSPHEIDLKPHFFDHAFGNNTPEATIAHELSHFPYIGNTKDHLYGPDAVSSLAARNSDVATDNAENYGMFIRAQETA
ncbi:M35 family metallopeptidase [Paraburkholderia aromaticivorans]|uniref:M35 family metallopeptidase n=1 Tax=Paraburkholderia aromaticivorans TaxID=2026199 RepID=UPI001455FE5B|nr:M35 family metallopeptidase [Paraburkholderia aromaticivorans]